jgi:hypothetical protein
MRPWNQPKAHPSPRAFAAESTNAGPLSRHDIEPLADLLADLVQRSMGEVTMWHPISFASITLNTSRVDAQLM